MAQINLLKQKTASQSFWEFFPSLMVKILAVAVVGVGAYYVWLYVQVGKADKGIAEQQALALAAQRSMDVANRDEIYTRQAQLAQLDRLIGKHLYWSNIFPPLAKATLKKASLSSIKVSKNATVTLSVSVPDLDSVDKFIQIFDQPEFNKNFSNLKLGAFHKTATEPPTYEFEAILDFNKSILNYQAPDPKAIQ